MIDDQQRRRWHRRAMLPEQKQDVTLADLGRAPKKVTEFVERFCAGECAGVGLALTGPPGRGKTTLTCAIVNDIVRKTPKHILGHRPEIAFSMNRPLLWVEYATYLSYKRQLMKLEVGTEDFNRLDVICEGIEAICPNDTWNPRLAVLDDLGKEHSTKSRWAEDTFDEVLRHRFNRGFVTIVTSNERVERWGEIYNESMASFAREAFVEVAVSGQDRRRA